MHAIVTSVLLLWSAAYAWLVASAFFGDRAAALNKLVEDGRITAAYADYILAIPGWVIGLSALLALLRLAGAGALLLRSSLATPIWTAALALTFVIMFRGFVLADAASVIRPSQMAVEATFMLISVLAVVYSRQLG